MIVGIGNDIIEISRIEKACKNENFIKKYFTEKERSISRGRPSFFAGNFAVKESVAKSLGTGFRDFGPIDIEVLRDEKGKPYVNLFGNAKMIMQDMKIDRIHVSISNLKELVSAIAIAESL